MRRLLLVCTLVWTAAAEAGSDGPEISRSRGKTGGAVVLWPRVVPAEGATELSGLAAELQSRLAQIAADQTDAAKISVRPAPERVCPLAGCKVVSVGAVLGHHGGGCFAVALVGHAGGGPVQLVPWAGEVLASARQVPHRDLPENKLAVKEFVPCDQLLTRLNDDNVARALKAALVPDPASQAADGG